MQIHIHRDGKTAGPYSLEQVRQMLATGQVQANDLAHHAGLASWTLLSQVLSAVTPPPIPTAPAASASRDDGPRDMEFAVECRPDFAFLTVQVPAGQTLKVEASAMATMSSNMVMKTKMRGGLSRFLTGESLFLNEFTAGGGPGEIGIAPGSPGDLEHVHLNGDTIFLQSSGFVASGMGVQVDSKWQGFKGFFSGEALFLIRCTGQGDLWFNTFGAMIPIDVTGDYVVDTGHIVAFTEGLQYEIGRIGGLKSLFFSGEGLVCRFRGQGRVWIQTRQLPSFAWWTYPFRPTKD